MIHRGDAIKWAPGGLLSPGSVFGMRGFKRFAGTRVTVLEGEGTKENMYREVTYWFDEEENLLARHDPADDIDTTRGPQDSSPTQERN